MKKKIFISSTCYDLIDLRAELKIFLQDKGFKPIMSDQFDSEFATYADVNSIETCLINLRNADLVIFILSQRYGKSLKKAGFEDFSATHLEYLEAIKEKKRIILFVRDRLEAEYNVYKDIKKANLLTWVQEKDVRIFEIIEKHKELFNSNKNNWYWNFRNSVEIKERLLVDLQHEMHDIKLQALIHSGNVPLMIIYAKIRIEDLDMYSGSKILSLSLSTYNVGTQPAIEAILIAYPSMTLKNVLALKENGFKKTGAQAYFINSIKSFENTFSYDFRFHPGIEIVANRPISFTIEVMYMNIQGDIISDITLLNGKIENVNLDVEKNYSGKSYRTRKFYDHVMAFAEK